MVCVAKPADFQWLRVIFVMRLSLLSATELARLAQQPTIADGIRYRDSSPVFHRIAIDLSSQRPLMRGTPAIRGGILFARLNPMRGRCARSLVYPYRIRLFSQAPRRISFSTILAFSKQPIRHLWMTIEGSPPSPSAAFKTSLHWVIISQLQNGLSHQKGTSSSVMPCAYDVCSASCATRSSRCEGSTCRSLTRCSL